MPCPGQKDRNAPEKERRTVRSPGRLHRLGYPAFLPFPELAKLRCSSTCPSAGKQGPWQEPVFPGTARNPCSGRLIDPAACHPHRLHRRYLPSRPVRQESACTPGPAQTRQSRCRAGQADLAGQSPASPGRPPARRSRNSRPDMPYTMPYTVAASPVVCQNRQQKPPQAVTRRCETAFGLALLMAGAATASGWNAARCAGLPPDG